MTLGPGIDERMRLTFLSNFFSSMSTFSLYSSDSSNLRNASSWFVSMPNSAAVMLARLFEVGGHVCHQLGEKGGEGQRRGRREKETDRNGNGEQVRRGGRGRRARTSE